MYSVLDTTKNGRKMMNSLYAYRNFPSLRICRKIAYIWALMCTTILDGYSKG